MELEKTGSVALRFLCSLSVDVCEDSCTLDNVIFSPEWSGVDVVVNVTIPACIFGGCLYFSLALMTDCLWYKILQYLEIDHVNI